MTQAAPRFTRALAPLLAATALVSIPAFAQDATPQTAQPVVTPPQSATVAIPPVVRTVPDGATAAPAAEQPAPRAQTRSTATRSSATRTATRTAPVRPAAAPAVPVAAPAPAPETAAQPAPPAAAPAAQAPSAPDASLTSDVKTAQPATTQSTTTTTGVPTWAIVAGALAALAILIGAIAALRRRRTDEYDYAEPVYVDQPDQAYVEPVAVPVAAAPLVTEPRHEPELFRREVEPELASSAAAAEDVEVSTPAAAEVAELTAGAAPVAERPWLEFAMRPVRAGTNVDEALVEIELTVGNAGSVPAKDVRISTFLLSTDPGNSEMERLLVQPPADTTTDPVTIQPGEGTRIDATLALLKSDMGEDLPASFRPIVVADARYTLADGSEGRTSASFSVGVTPEEGGALEPIELSRASMHDNVGAELHGEPQHA